MKRTKRECYIGDDGYCHIPLANGKGEAICDKEFFEEVNKHSWAIKKGYCYCHYKYRHTPLHRFVYLLKFKNIENGNVIDHKNRNPLDNRIENLREASFCQNSLNRGVTKRKYKGVRKTRSGMYEASVKLKNKRVHIGTFKNQEEAAYHFDLFSYHNDIEFSFLNFPQNIEKYKNQKPIKIIKKKTKTSNFTGVYLHKRENKFCAFVKIDGKSCHIGIFKDDISAAHARDMFVLKNNLNKKLNFPKETYETELNQQPKQMVLFKAS